MYFILVVVLTVHDKNIRGEIIFKNRGKNQNLKTDRPRRKAAAWHKSSNSLLLIDFLRYENFFFGVVRNKIGFSFLILVLSRLSSVIGGCRVVVVVVVVMSLLVNLSVFNAKFRFKFISNYLKLGEVLGQWHNQICYHHYCLFHNFHLARSRPNAFCSENFSSHSEKSHLFLAHNKSG